VDEIALDAGEIPEDVGEVVGGGERGRVWTWARCDVDVGEIREDEDGVRR
jgi:hypothetical protein